MVVEQPSCENRNRSTLKCRKKCCRKNRDVVKDNTRQHQLGLEGSGDYCARGCCDFSDRFAKHVCTRPKRF